MNEEPTYEFVRGVGWVPQTIERIRVNSRHGSFWLERREPTTGERYATFSKRDIKFVKEGILQLNVFKDYLETNTDWVIASYATEGHSLIHVDSVRCTFVFDV